MPLQCFRCARTGLYYPLDIHEKWGTRYGRGLGKQVVSEAVTNFYNSPIAVSRDSSRTMHPIGYCRAQLDFVTVEEEEYAAHIPIILQDDLTLERIGKLMRDKQLIKSSKMQERFPKEIAFAKERIAEYEYNNYRLFAPQALEKAKKAK